MCMLSYTKRTLQVTTNMFDLLTFLVKAPSKKGGGFRHFSFHIGLSPSAEKCKKFGCT